MIKFWSDYRKLHSVYCFLQVFHGCVLFESPHNPEKKVDNGNQLSNRCISNCGMKKIFNFFHDYIIPLLELANFSNFLSNLQLVR